MKEIKFLKKGIIVNKGLYDNVKVFENSVESFKAAIKNRLGIYFSIQITKDGQLIVFNDASLERMMNLKEQVTDLTYEEIEYYSRYHIPLLSEVLDLVSGSVPIIINPRTYTHKFTMEKLLVNLLDKYNGHFAVMSSNKSKLKWFNINRPDYIVGEILTKNKYNITSLRDLFSAYSVISDFKSVNVKYISSKEIRIIRNENKILIGFLIDNDVKYKLYKDDFDVLIVDNIKSLCL